jgi:SPP1 gp7 family putative phage head morphogenesis protein
MEKQAMQQKTSFYNKETKHTHVHESAGREEQIPNKKEWPKEWKSLENQYAKFVVNKLSENIGLLKEGITKERLEGISLNITERKSVDLDDVNRVTNNFYREVKEKGIDIPRKAYEVGVNKAQSETKKSLSFNLEDYDTLMYLDEKNTDLLLGVSDELKNRLKSNIRIGVAKGESIDQIKSRIDGVEETYSGRIETIARTEVSNAVNMGRLNGYEQAGVKIVEWLAADDACPDCEALNTKTMTIEEAQGQIPLHPNCRCTYIAHFEE